MTNRGPVSAELVLATPLLLVLIMVPPPICSLGSTPTHVADAVAEQGLAVARLQGGTAAARPSRSPKRPRPARHRRARGSHVTATRTATTTTFLAIGQEASSAVLTASQGSCAPARPRTTIQPPEFPLLKPRMAGT